MALVCDEQKFESWTVKTQKSHILGSICVNAKSGGCEGKPPASKCDYCSFTSSVELPHLPEMVFPNNILTVCHESGCGFTFQALEALKTVIVGSMPLKVACSDVWKSSRQDSGYMDRLIHSFDWTFTTLYRGSLLGNFVVDDKTECRINLEKLKEKEQILHYEDMMLFEDELHDNGISVLSVKIRVMPSGFFILLRFFLRVDGVLVRINDTRIHHEFCNNYAIRETTLKESQISELNVPLGHLGDPNLILPHLNLKTTVCEKLSFPSS
ncbi:unnamed protein product [Bemisia tabaci]|uniref:TIP41-like protein n=1 Tax=Bemisia tabaci TaxID=7038 RepID=A0A9P0AA70_BEMTA|nr:PREDICTED: TIP41-like protein [Bemisia tabaci]CAH0387283.1 unnamed protein product [Bemisia tabaci]